MSQGGAGPQLQLPMLLPWMRNVLVGLFALFVVELLARNAGFPVERLRWHAFGHGFELWQPLTRFFVQGGSTGAVFNVLIGLLVLYFFLPGLDSMMPRERIGKAALAGAVGGTAVPMLLDLLLLDGGSTGGWTVLTTALVVLFGLAMPNGVIHLWFVLPITGSFIVWGTLGLSVVFFLIGPALGTSEAIGTWAGVFGWWHLMGPGARRRDLKRQASRVEQELRRFEVIEGGRSQPQGGQGRPDDDDWVH